MPRLAKKPATAHGNQRRRVDPMNGADQESVWSKIANEMVEDEGTRALDLPSKLNRRKSIEQEHRWRRATIAANELKHPLAMTQE